MRIALGRDLSGGLWAAAWGLGGRDGVSGELDCVHDLGRSDGQSFQEERMGQGVQVYKLGGWSLIKDVRLRPSCCFLPVSFCNSSDQSC